LPTASNGQELAFAGRDSLHQAETIAIPADRHDGGGESRQRKKGPHGPASSPFPSGQAIGTQHGLRLRGPEAGLQIPLPPALISNQ
jgi:hypothetical protein